MSNLIVVVGGQFGSEGKGAVVGHLACRYHQPLVIRTGGPQAGHTVVDHDGVTHKLRMLPAAVATNPGAVLALAPRAVVHPDRLEKELAEFPDRFIHVDKNATILEDTHRTAELEDPDLQWGSTRQGVGAARSARLHRTAKIWGSRHQGQALAADVTALARRELRQFGGTVLVEAAQGYGLGLHTKYYPKTTSADCRAIDALADCGISPWQAGTQLTVWIVVRPYPIRVAGDSGPLHDETNWEALGLPEERTTVTNKVRRVGKWDPELLIDAVLANGGGFGSPNRNRVRVWLSMADQVVPSLAGKTSISQVDSEETVALTPWLNRVRECGAEVWGLGTGPASAIVLGEPRAIA